MAVSTTGLSKVECPICGKLFAKSIVNEHANRCLSEADDEVDDAVEPGAKRARLSVELSSPHSTNSSDQSSPPICSLSPGCSWSQKPETSQSTPNAMKGPWKNFVRQAAGSLKMFNGKSCSKRTGKTTKCEKNEELNALFETQTDDGDQTLSPLPSTHNGASFNAVKSSRFPHLAEILDGVPLAEKMRPTSLAEFVGQCHVIGSRKPLNVLIESSHIASMILWGPPGCGKTTLARIISEVCRKSASMRFVTLSASTACLADVKEAIKTAKSQRVFQRKTVLFVDEIHRFNKLQQDSFLPHIEDGTIVFVGATTENPSFHVNNALLSRCQVVVLDKLLPSNIETVLHRALQELAVTVTDCSRSSAAAAAAAATDDDSDDDDDYDNAHKLRQQQGVLIDNTAVETLCTFCDGDARVALNGLQTALCTKLVLINSSDANILSSSAAATVVVTAADIKDALQQSHLQYDRNGDEHYNCASALQKSIRGSDANAAVYWLSRMLEAGEDPLFIARRLVQCSSEDIGLADSQALPIAVATFHACQLLGMPECAVNLSHCTVYLARAAKSNESYVAMSRARSAIKQQQGPQPAVPLHLRNATSALAAQQGCGKGYQYSHDVEVDTQVYLPTQLANVNFFSKSAASSRV